MNFVFYRDLIYIYRSSAVTPDIGKRHVNAPQQRILPLPIYLRRQSLAALVKDALSSDLKNHIYNLFCFSQHFVDATLVYVLKSN